MPHEFSFTGKIEFKSTYNSYTFHIRGSIISNGEYYYNLPGYLYIDNQYVQKDGEKYVLNGPASTYFYNPEANGNPLISAFRANGKAKGTYNQGQGKVSYTICGHQPEIM